MRACNLDYANGKLYLVRERDNSIIARNIVLAITGKDIKERINWKEKK